MPTSERTSRTVDVKPLEQVPESVAGDKIPAVALPTPGLLGTERLVRRNAAVQHHGPCGCEPGTGLVRRHADPGYPFEIDEAGPTVLAGGLTVGHADDPAEAAADRAADAALRRLGPDDELARETGAGQLQRTPGPVPAAAPISAPVVGRAGGDLDTDLSGRIDGARGGGRALAGDVRGRMETAFGTDFGGVRIHDDDTSAGLSGAVSALAFTTGKDIFFGKGQFAPETPAGEHMLAHELAHTLQGGATIGRWNPFKKTDEEKATQQKKEDEKAAKKKAKDAQTAQVAAHKKLEKSEKKSLAADRVTGTKARSEMGSLVTGDQADGNVTSATMNELNKKQAALIARETQVKEQMVATGIEKDEAEDVAYEQVWLNEAGPEMQAFKPPRQSAAEKLTRDVRAQRNDDSAVTRNEDQQRADSKHGTMLSKTVEKTYDDYVRKVAHWMDPSLMGLDEDQATILAENEIWGSASDKAKELRPTDPKIEAVAIADARKRTAIALPEKAPESDLDTAIGGLGTADSVAKVAGPGLGAALTPLSKAGKTEDRQLATDAGMTPTESFTPGSLPVVGELAGAIKSSQGRLAKGQATDASVPLKPMSIKTQAAQGVGSATGVLTSLMSAVSNILKLAKAIKDAQEHGDTAGKLLATKAAADAAASVMAIGKSSATLAKVIDPGVTNAVSTVIPGLNIFVSTMNIVSGAITTAEVGIRLSDANENLTAARVRTPGATKADVMVQPLLHVASACAKQLEQAIWSTAVSVSDFATSVATVATAGGFGIPAAVQAGVKLLDLLHSAGHFVADNVLAKFAQNSRTDAMQALEGSSENQLRMDPAMAVDGIIMRARKGDTVAVTFLTNYRVTPEEIKTGKLAEVREKVLSRIGENADPKLIYQVAAEKLKAVKKFVVEPGKWATTGELAADRNGLDTKSRGFGWRVKMLLKSEEKLGRSVRKTQARTGANPKAGPAPTVQDNSTMGMSLKDFHQQVACYVGRAHLMVSATPQQVEVFIRMVQDMGDAAIQQAIANPNNTDDWKQVLVGLLADRAQQAAPVPVGAP